MIHPATHGMAIRRVQSIGMMMMLIGMTMAPVADSEKPHKVQGQVILTDNIRDVWVLVYLDDLYYNWTIIGIKNETTALCVTIDACTSLGIALNYSMSQYGAFLTSLFGVAAPSDYSWWWEMLLWNDTSRSWQESPKGASDLWLSGHESICWCPNYSAPPIQTPLGWTAWPSFRADPSNSGTSSSSSPKEKTVFGQKDFGNGPIDSTPAYADGMYFVSTGGVYNWSEMRYEKPPHLYAFSEEHWDDLVWACETTAAGWQVSSPAVMNGAVYIGTSDGNVMAFSEFTGALRWTFRTGASATGVTSSPLALSSGIYVPAGDGLLYAFSPDSTQLWNFSLGGPAYMTSPAYSNGRLFVGSDSGVLSCVALNGTMIWNHTVEGKIRSSPVIAGATVVVISTVYNGWAAIGSSIYALAADSGTQLWNASIDASTSSPTTGNDRIFVGTNSGIVAFDLQGHQLWFHQTSGPVQCSPAYCGGTLYYGLNTENGTFYCLDVENEPFERWNFTPMPHQYILSSPIIGVSNVVLCSDNGILYSGGQPPQALLDFTVDIPNKAIEGRDAKIRVNLVNIGDIAANNISVTLYVDSVMDWVYWILDPVNITRLDPGQNISVMFNLTLKAGTHQVEIEPAGGYLVNGSYKGGLIEVNKSEEPARFPAELTFSAIILFLGGAMIVIIVLRRPRCQNRRNDEKK